MKADKTIGTTTTSTTYKYDPFGNRIEKTISGVTTKYLYDGTNILYEYNGSNAITTRYTHNISIDDPLGLETGGKLYAYHKDTLGSIRTITDSTQKTINTYSYDSFGNTTQTGTFVQPYAYTGRELDKDTGLYYYRARYYDSVAGRFIQKDPIGFRGEDVNLYGYVQNNPVNFIDPSGLFPMYGNWGGANWSGGKSGSIIPSNPAPPKDAYDACYMQHDYCYASATKSQNSQSCGETPTIKECDLQLAICSSAMPRGTGGLWGSVFGPASTAWATVKGELGK